MLHIIDDYLCPRGVDLREWSGPQDRFRTTGWCKDYGPLPAKCSQVCLTSDLKSHHPFITVN